MRMTPAQLGRVATNLLKVVRSRKLENLEALEKVAEEPIDPDADDRYAGEEYVIVRRRGGGKFSIDYFRRHGQTPILIMVDSSYLKCMLTVDRQIDGYDAFDDTPDGKMQDRTLGPCEFARIPKELETLIAWSAAQSAGGDPRGDEVDDALEAAYATENADDVVEILEPALETARAIGDDRRIAACLLRLGEAERFAEMPAESRSHLEEALATFERTRDLGAMDKALGNLLGLSREEARYPEARAYGERLLEVSRERDDPQEVGRSHYNLAYLHHLEGNKTEAERSCLRAVPPLMQVGDTGGLKAVKELQEKLHGKKSVRKTPAKPKARKKKKK